MNQNDKLFVRNVLYTAMPGIDFVHHDGERCEVKRNIPAQSSSRAGRDRMSRALIDQVKVSNLAEVRIKYLTAFGKKPMVQDPRQIIPVGNPKNQRLLRTESRNVICSSPATFASPKLGKGKHFADCTARRSSLRRLTAPGACRSLLAWRTR